MPTILSLSSQVARGHVGHSAAVFAWQRLGFDVIALPTVILSNRPDYPHRAGLRMEPDTLAAMLAAIEANGWLAGVDAIFTGYMPSAAHVEVAAEWVTRLKAQQSDLIYMCDPILGDEPGGLYVPREAAEAIRDTLVPLAHIITPNLFELSWLSGQTIVSFLDAVGAANQLHPPSVLATSVPNSGDELANLLWAGTDAWWTEVARRTQVPHGTGDLMAALYLGHFLRTRDEKDALALATAGLEAVIEASAGCEELQLVASQDRWAAPEPWPATQAFPL